MASSTIVTKELLFELRACTESIYAIKNRGMWGRPISEILDMLEKEGIDHGARAWWAEQEDTEKFVRLTGSVFTMNEKFKIFNPLSGTHEEFTDIKEARSRLVDIATQVMLIHTPRMVTELINENGDSTWIPTDEHQKLIINISS